MNDSRPLASRFDPHQSPEDDNPTTQFEVRDRSIGELIREARGLSEQQIEEVLAYQRQHGLRFGEAVVALKLASSDDVLRALSQQYHYDYTPALSLGEKSSELIVATNPFSDEAEAFRDLRSQLMMGVLSEEQPRRALAILSPDIGDGKTYIAANMAIAFSQLGGRTLLVDADMRTPRQHVLFDADHTSGLSTILSGRAENGVVQQVKNLPSLYVMPVGAVPPNPMELVQRPAFGLLLHELLSKFDHVLVDTPAAVHGADARVIAAHAGAALVVGRKGRSRMAAMEGLLKKLGKSPVAIAGVVMNEY
jgi:protein-tyrosine kinase